MHYIGNQRIQVFRLQRKRNKKLKKNKTLKRNKKNPRKVKIWPIGDSFAFASVYDFYSHFKWFSN